MPARLAAWAIAVASIAACASPNAGREAGDAPFEASIEQVLELARGYGEAELIEDDGGERMVQARISRLRYGIFFGGCNARDLCKTMQFVAGFATDRLIGLAEINDWNAARRFGKVFLDEDGDPVVQLAVNLDYGVSRRNLDDTFDWWGAVLRDFAERVLIPDRGAAVGLAV